jgi:mono/diheme cytochrome c family protein
MLHKRSVPLAILMIALLSPAFLTAACGSGDDPAGKAGTEKAAAETGAAKEPERGDPGPGAGLYADKCSSCHGDGGTGGFAPSHVGCDMCGDFAALYEKIDGDMPRGEPGACTGECAADTAAYIYIELNGNSF